MHSIPSLSRSLFRALMISAVVLFTFNVEAQFSYTTIGVAYNQSFNSIGTANITTPDAARHIGDPQPSAVGWYFFETGSSMTNNLVVAAGTGSGTAGDTYHFGLAGNADRALGGLRSGTLTPTVGFWFTNNTGQTINSIAIQYTGETWRVGAATRSDGLDFQYSTDATTLSNGTWTDVNALDYFNPGQATGSGTLQHSALISNSITGLCLANGATLFMRWSDFDVPAGSEDGIGVDGFSMTGTTVPTIQQNSTGFSGSFGNVNVGASSASSSFVVSGCSLTNDLLVTPPTGFEVRIAPNPFQTGALNLGTGTVAPTTIDVRFTPIAPGFVSGNVNCTSIGATAPPGIPVDGTGIAATPPTQLVVTSLNGGNNVIESTAFSIAVQAQDGANVPQNVVANTDVQVVINTGSGPLGGTITGTILAGTDNITISGITYGTPETGVVLDVQRTNGDVLTTGSTGPFDVLGAAQDLGFNGTPAGGVVNTTVATFQVQALRADANVATEFTGNITISVLSGPGNMLGTLTQPALNGTATFNDISFDATGSYILQATASGLNNGNSPTIIITNVPTMTELVVPRYIGSKSAAGTNVTRTPMTACVQWDNLLPNTSYKVDVGMALLADAANLIGAGNKWVAGAFGTGSFSNAFTTDGTGSSGPFWFHMEVTANGTRFDAGQVHHLRFKTVPQSSSFPTNPNFTGTKTITALDLPNTARTPATTDDGAYLKGHAPQCVGGLHVLSYDNTAGTGDPLSVYMVRQAVPTFGASDLTGHPASIQPVLAQVAPSVVGDYVLVIPIGANNANGVRRIELRDDDNNITSSITDADGVWPGGANTTTNARRSVVNLSAADGALAPDADGDDICDDDDNCVNDANANQANADGDALGDVCDLCPNLANIEPGDACDDTFANTVLDVYGASPTCGCAGTPCTTDLNLIFNPDGVTNIQWELRQQGSNIVVQSGGGVYPLVTEYSVETCLPDGDFYLVVTSDQVGGGIVQGGVLGGYRLETDAGVRLIDNRNNYLSGATSAIAGGEGFTLPVGADRVIYTSCDKVDWRTGEYIVANDNPTISALWPSGGDDSSLSNDGYEMWFYNPNGGYSFRRFHSHATSDGFAPANAQRACHIKINNWSAVNHIPTGVLMNVKVRGRVDNSNLDWGAACRFKLDPTRAECPLTHLMDVPGSTQLSCGGTRAIGSGGANLVHARPVTRYLGGVSTAANKYQFRFRIPAEFVDFTKTSNTGQYWVNTTGLAPCKSYLVEVRASFNNGGSYCDTYAAANPYSPLWGRTCVFNTSGCPNPEGNGGDQNMAVDGSTGSPRQMVLYPNPNNGEQLFLSMDMVQEGVSKVSVDIFDTFGQRVNTSTIAVNDGFVNTTLDLNGGLAAGMYIVNITAGDVTYTERLVVQP